MNQGANKVYEKQGYIILRVRNVYIVSNTNTVFSEGHTHLKSFTMAKTLIDNCIKHKRPKTNNYYVITSHIRVADDSNYIMKLEQLLDVKKASHKDNYVNGSR